MWTPTFQSESRQNRRDVFPKDLDPSLRGIGKVYPLGLEEAAEVLAER